MPDQIYIGNFAKGLKLDREPYDVDNDAFPVLYNFYIWRGRAKRKRGTAILGQLTRQIKSVLDADPSKTSWQYGQLTRIGGFLNLISGSGITLESTSIIVPGSINLTVLSSGNLVTDLLMDGTIQIGASTVGTINYATGEMFFSNLGAGTLTGTYSYSPRLPVLGLEDFSSTPTSSLYPIQLSFDQTYSYQIFTENGYFSTSYYKNSNNPVIWTGPNYGQFWTTNYQGALWATNNKPGFHFQLILTITIGSPTTITTNAAHGLITGDYVWFNEITGTDAALLNLQTSIIIVTGPTTFTVAIDTTGKVINNDGMFQTLTKSQSGQDGIRWYDGDPTSATGLPTGTGLGWVNFAPPLTAAIVSIDDTPARKYYLIGALAIVAFKDRLLFFSPFIGTSTGVSIQLQDTVIWSWNGTPYYASLVPVNQTFDPKAFYVDQTGLGGYLPAGISNPIITVNSNEDALMVGFGGDGRKTRFIYTGDDLQPFLFFSINSDLPSTATFSALSLDRGVLDIGAYGLALTDQQSSQRVDLDIPDEIFQIQSTENGMKRVNAIRNFFREWCYFSYPISTVSYDDKTKCFFPIQSFLFNYRDNTWAIIYENFTKHGTFRASTKRTWLTLPFKTWDTWREPWNSGASNALFPTIIAGNPQGFVLKKDTEGTSESISGNIQSISDDGNGNTLILSTDHCVTDANPTLGQGDFLLIDNAIGITTFTITAITAPGIIPLVLTSTNTFVAGQFIVISGVVGMTELNGNTYEIYSATGTTITIQIDSTGFGAYVSGGIVQNPFNGIIAQVKKTPDKDHFVIDIPYPVNTYAGLGTYARLSQPLLLSKQFPVYWNEGRQCRLSVQKYLMDTTDSGQVTVNIYLSQDQNDAWNNPINAGEDNGLVYSQIMYTCPESTNLGLTPANVNLQMPTGISQKQIWHRFNTSLIGDSVQIGITLSEEQMKDEDHSQDEITLNGMHLIVDKGPHLA